MQLNKNIEIGDYTYGTFIPYRWNDDTKLKIGKFCSLADNIKIYMGGNHRTDWVSAFPFYAKVVGCERITNSVATKGDILIGNDVWIGSNVVILSGVTIGDGAVIGNSCVVAKDVEPYAVVVGNPQREVRKRFSQEQIDQLLELEWWNWEIEKIVENIDLICSPDVDVFLNTFFKGER